MVSLELSRKIRKSKLPQKVAFSQAHLRPAAGGLSVLWSKFLELLGESREEFAFPQIAELRKVRSAARTDNSFFLPGKDQFTAE